MGAPDDDKLWVAVQIPGAEEYVVVHSKLERGWVPRKDNHFVYGKGRHDDKQRSKNHNYQSRHRRVWNKILFGTRYGY